MRRSELYYDLPADRIAQHPAQPRDAARLLVLERASGRCHHRRFRDILEYLRPGDCLVLNDTRVIPARFFCRRRTGGRVEALFICRHDLTEPAEAWAAPNHRPAPESGTPQPPPEVPADLWRVMLAPSARLDEGELLKCEGSEVCLRLIRALERGEWLVRPEPSLPPLELLARLGHTPLPPYIERSHQPEPADADRYQTVYAARDGAVAAPTAGLHFTPELLERVRAAGVLVVCVTLHVGPGTFLPIDVEDLTAHRMHPEWFEVRQEAAARLNETRAAGGRILAVGTTSMRVLESQPAGRFEARSGWTHLFIYPPYVPRHVDALLTNFHLPGSTLLALVMAVAGIDTTRQAYREAIERGYRFYSFGDAMLIL